MAPTKSLEGLLFGNCAVFQEVRLALYHNRVGQELSHRAASVSTVRTGLCRPASLGMDVWLLRELFVESAGDRTKVNRAVANPQGIGVFSESIMRTTVKDLDKWVRHALSKMSFLVLGSAGVSQFPTGLTKLL